MTPSSDHTFAVQGSLPHHRWSGVVLAVGAGSWTVLISWFAVARHLAMQTGFDTAVYSHTLWTTTQGYPFWNSLVEDITSFLGHHFAPLLLVLAPIYGLWPNPRLLLFLQVLILALAVIPLFLFARSRVGDRLGLLTAATFLLSPALQWIAINDFHEIALAVPLLMAGGAALLNRRRKGLILWLILVLLVKEEIALIAFGFGLYALLILRDSRLGWALMAGVIVWGVLLFGTLMPAFSSGGGSFGFIWRYRSLGDTPVEVLVAPFTKPALVLEIVSTPEKALFVFQLLAPLAGLPLVGVPANLLVLPSLSYLLLSDYSFQTSLQHHYTATVLPFLFLATVIALQKVRSRNPRWANLAGGVLLMSAIGGAALWSPLPGSRAHKPEIFAVTEEARAIHRLLAAIPRQAVVAADSPYQPWLASRLWIADIGTVPFTQFAPAIVPEYVADSIPDPYAVSPPRFPWIVAGSPGKSIQVTRYALAAATPGGVGVWRVRPPDESVTLYRYEASFYGGLTLVGAGVPPESPRWGTTVYVRRGEVLPVWLAWNAGQPLQQRITFSLHLRSEDGQTRSQVDSEMGQGRFPTTLWHTWLNSPVVVGEFPLPIPADLPPGRYRLLAGAFETATVSALTMQNGEQWLEITVLEVTNE